MTDDVPRAPAVGSRPEAVTEWRPARAARRRAAARAAVVGLLAEVALGVWLVHDEAGTAATAAVLVAGAAFVASAVAARPFAASGPAASRAPVVTDPAALAPLRVQDVPAQRRARVARATAAAVLAVVAVGVVGSGAEAAWPAAAVALVSLLAVDVPWLRRLRRVGRGGLVRATVTVTAVPSGGGRRLRLETETVAWTAPREGVLHDAVAGDVLLADLDPRDSTPLVLTLGARRSLAPAMNRIPRPRG
ncbi:MAG: hypothetical protein U0Q15_18595 [Kineosporiaceae bacterium]